MSDWIMHDGKRYFEESYLVLANSNAKRVSQSVARRCAEIADTLDRETKHTPGFYLGCRAVAQAIRLEFGLITPESEPEGK